MTRGTTKANRRSPPPPTAKAGLISSRISGGAQVAPLRCPILRLRQTNCIGSTETKEAEDRCSLVVVASALPSSSKEKALAAEKPARGARWTRPSRA